MVLQEINNIVVAYARLALKNVSLKSTVARR